MGQTRFTSPRFIPGLKFGIDPGVNTGLAEMHDREIRAITTTDFWGAYDYIRMHEPQDVALIVIEISRDTNIYHDKARAGNKRVMGKVGQLVGGVRKEGELLAKRLKEKGYAVKTVRPRGKINKEQFQKVTGCKIRTNGHGRDAAMLLWN